MLEEIRFWVRDHRIIALSAVNALSIFVVVCLLGFFLGLSRSGEAHAETRMAGGGGPGEKSRSPSAQEASGAVPRDGSIEEPPRVAPAGKMGPERAPRVRARRPPRSVISRGERQAETGWRATGAVPVEARHEPPFESATRRREGPPGDSVDPALELPSEEATSGEPPPIPEEFPGE